MAAEKKKFKDFESALTRLDEITRQLESGEIKLEESIALYSEGVEIAAFCSKTLSGAENKIMKLKEQQEKLVEVPFDEEEDGD
ncbi:MAG: exodeoxyribonuclease VII small subunit [candidate division Zixibacteria bacterium HGW-Zixibacteria-1]|nr:MAG: exodeoxyribonuclease VII small subunit [candidate division Zixibacteria bacterium HGW-Zixibacteria-1]